jgi:hypothetical protein
VTVTNSTISGNSAGAGSGGGIFGFNIPAFGVVAPVHLVYATVVDNSAPTASNLTVLGGSLTSFGSVLALPGGGGTNCAGVTTTSNGFNFSDDDSCGFTAGGDTQNGGDPKLAPLTNTGGPTQTRLPALTSPLVNAIPNADCQADSASGITTDQRGLPRPDSANPACDIGAVEVQPGVIIGRLQGLINDVTGFHLPFGAQTSLTAPLDAVQTTLSAGNTDGACGALGAFINHVHAQPDNQLTQTQADQLIAGATQLSSDIGC